MKTHDTADAAPSSSSQPLGALVERLPDPEQATQILNYVRDHLLAFRHIHDKCPVRDAVGAISTSEAF